MRRIRLASVNDFAEWRAAARALLLAAVPPDEVQWIDPGQPPDMFGDEVEAAITPVLERKVGRVPPRFLKLGQAAICHTDSARFATLYSLLWRLQKDRRLLTSRDDPDVSRLNRRVEQVVAEYTRMKTELRFRRAVSADGHKGLMATFVPKHYVLERVAPHFVNEIHGEDWVITTPYRSAYWDRRELSFGPGREAPQRRNQMALSIIAPISKTAEVAAMAVQSDIRPVREARRPVPDPSAEQAEYLSLAEARAAVQGCRRCPLFEHATQAVFGEGPERAEVMFVGEQPGDQEDLAGVPFVGPAGRLFDAALERVGIDRRRTYVTNAVKHFKFVPRGKRRLHQRPNAGEISGCRFWLDLERAFVKPRVIVALGATAVQSILGRPATITSLRGKPIELDDGTLLYVTIHPSYLLRIRDPADKKREAHAFEMDLKRVRGLLEGAQTRH